jgi:hypothetical protein
MRYALRLIDIAAAEEKHGCRKQKRGDNYKTEKISEPAVAVEGIYRTVIMVREKFGRFFEPRNITRQGLNYIAAESYKDCDADAGTPAAPAQCRQKERNAAKEKREGEHEKRCCYK